MNELDDKNRNSQIWTVKGNRWGKNRAVGTYETIEKEYLCHWRPRKRKWSLTCILSKDGWRLPKLGNRRRFKKLKNPRQDNPKKKKFRPRHVIKILKIKEKNYCMIILCLTFWGTVILFSTVTAPFYIPTCHIQGFWFFHIFTNPCYYLFILFYFTFSIIAIILMCVKWYFIGVLICISLISIDIEHPFMYILIL